MVWILFYSEFEWWGQKYKPSEEIRRKTQYLFGTLDPEKRFERSPDAPPPPPPKDGPEPIFNSASLRPLVLLIR
ncbi:hypothetical protein ACJ41O_004597 [Fusarium nematophilum]